MKQEARGIIDPEDERSEDEGNKQAIGKDKNFPKNLWGFQKEGGLLLRGVGWELFPNTQVVVVLFSKS